MSGPSPSRPCSDANSRRWSLRATACWRSDCSSPSAASSRGGRRGRHRVRAGGRRPAPSRPRHSSRSSGVVLKVPRAALRRRERRTRGDPDVPGSGQRVRRRVLLARTVALVAVVGVPYAVVGAGVWLTVAPDTGIFATHAGIDSPVLYLRFLAFVLLLGAAYVSLAAAVVSARRAESSSAIALGVLALVAGVLGGDLLLLRSLGGGASPATISGSLALAPNGAFRGLVFEHVIGVAFAPEGWVRLDEPRGRIAGRLGASRRWPRGRGAGVRPPRRRFSNASGAESPAERAREWIVVGQSEAASSLTVPGRRRTPRRGRPRRSGSRGCVRGSDGPAWARRRGRCPRPRSIG